MQTRSMAHWLALPCSMFFLMCSPTSGLAETAPLTYDRVDVSATSAGEVRNDVVTAIVYREVQGPDVTALTAEVNKSITQALQRLKQLPNIKVQTQDYETYPVYDDKGKFTGWRVRQSIRLESRDIAGLSTVLGELQQQQLNLGSIQYSAAPETLRKAEDTLITDALRAFEQRAELVAHDLNHTKYRIVAIRVDTGRRPITYAPPAPAMVAAEAGATPPPIEPGTGQVEVTVSGTVELQ